VIESPAEMFWRVGRNVAEADGFYGSRIPSEEMGEKEGFLTEQVLQTLQDGASLRDLPGVPQSVKERFITIFEIPPLHHVRIQAAFQEYTDNAVSKTINFSREATQEEVKEAFLIAYREKCKGITIYRSGSKPGQVLACGTRQVC